MIIFNAQQGGIYAAHEIRCDIGGRGFHVHRIGTGRTYHVRIGAPEDTDCECLGYLRWNHCKHLDRLTQLLLRETP
jgi:hypothetical protein